MRWLVLALALIATNACAPREEPIAPSIIMDGEEIYFFGSMRRTGLNESEIVVAIEDKQVIRERTTFMGRSKPMIGVWKDSRVVAVLDRETSGGGADCCPNSFALGVAADILDTNINYFIEVSIDGEQAINLNLNTFEDWTYRTGTRRRRVQSATTPLPIPETVAGGPVVEGGDAMRPLSSKELLYLSGYRKGRRLIRKKNLVVGSLVDPEWFDGIGPGIPPLSSGLGPES